MRFDALAGVTIVTPDLDGAVADYGRLLGYRGDGIVRVAPQQAEAWAASGAAGARMAVLYPQRGARRFVRLVEGDPSPQFRPFASPGWAAAELIVQDLDRLAERLAQGPFAIIGEPAVLDFDFTDQIRAMQVRGAGGEVLYLTEVNALIPGFDLPRADSFVGELFVAVLGSRSIDAAAVTYADHGRPCGPRFAARIDVLSDAHRMPRAHRHALTTVALDDCSLIEIDEFPAGTTPRPPSSIGLPSGIAMVSVTGATAAAPGDRVVLRGACDEWIEVLPATR